MDLEIQGLRLVRVQIQDADFGPFFGRFAVQYGNSTNVGYVHTDPTIDIMCHFLFHSILHCWGNIIP